jgi:16S rRNA (cytosine967-C5)-methyltransferase
MISNERLRALHILSALLDNKRSLTDALRQPIVISPFTKELCFGVCRHYFRLQTLADLLVTKRPKSTEVWVCLLIGLYQLHYLDIADYAVVKETVELLPQVKATWAKGLINAVLRRYCREQLPLIQQLEAQPLYQYGHPEWFIKKIKNEWPHDWQAICSANDERPPMSLRVNSRASSRAEYLAQLTLAGIEAAPLQFSEQGIRLTEPCDVHDLPGFSEGLVAVQDEAAQLASTLLDLHPGLRVLDACCAPGGKTCHIVETQPDLAACIAVDVDATRLKRVQENLTRLKLKATLCVGDALKPEDWWDKVLFDRILLDAPCSATGVIRRHPDIKLLRTPKEIAAITLVQHKLLESLWPLLSPGGLMVYATCSIMPEENEHQISAFVERHADCETITTSRPWGHLLAHGVQILPGEHHMDGFFYSVLKKMS